MELEALCIELGITEHIPRLSEFRDDILRATAAQLQEAALEVAAKNAEIERLTSLLPPTEET